MSGLVIMAGRSRRKARVRRERARARGDKHREEWPRINRAGKVRISSREPNTNTGCLRVGYVNIRGLDNES